MTPEEEQAEVRRRLEDIKKNPSNHQHSYAALHTCCIVNSCVDMQLMEAHEKIAPQRNPKGCDVISGPCSCGAWH